MENYDKITKLLRDTLKELEFHPEQPASRYKVQIYQNKLNDCIHKKLSPGIKQDDYIKIKIDDTILEGKICFAKLLDKYWYIGFEADNGSYHIWKQQDDGGEIVSINNK
jgi:hypothetical protein